MTAHTVTVNRAPVLTLWGAVVAERLGHDRATALTLGRAVAGLNAQSKGRRLGVFDEPARGAAERRGTRGARRRPRLVPLLGRSVPAVDTAHGLRATEGGRPASAASVERYLRGKFGGALRDARAAMRALAAAYEPARLEEVGFALYERFRPGVPAGVRGWGAPGTLDLDLVRALATEADGA